MPLSEKEAGKILLQQFYAQQGVELRDSGELFYGDTLVGRVNLDEIRYDGERLDHSVQVIQPVEYIQVDIKI